MNLWKFSAKSIAFGLWLLLLVVLVLATAVEQWGGRAVALRWIYQSWWFVGGWAALVVCGFIYLIRRGLYRKKVVFLFHCALGVILAGAFVTFLFAERGYVHLRQGKPLSSYTLEDGITSRSLPFDVELVRFTIDYHRGTEQPADFISFIKIDGKTSRISMNQIQVYRHYRFYQTSYDVDEKGTLLMVYRDPWGIALTYAGYLLLAVCGLALLALRIGWKGLAGVFLPTLTVWYFISQLHPITPVLRTPMLAWHVSVIVVAYFLFFAMAVMSAVGLASKRLSDRLYRWNMRLLLPALLLLAAGIFIGAVWANISWGRYWGWDAKETWALITLLVYALPAHRKSLGFFALPRGFHRYCLLAFLAVLMTFFGVSFLLNGMHSYL
jgi:cytochrome c biogenesis factor